MKTISSPSGAGASVSGRTTAIDSSSTTSSVGSARRGRPFGVGGFDELGQQVGARQVLLAARSRCAPAPAPCHSETRGRIVR